jgi:hypothetical protein
MDRSSRRIAARVETRDDGLRVMDWEDNCLDGSAALCSIPIPPDLAKTTVYRVRLTS